MEINKQQAFFAVFPKVKWIPWSGSMSRSRNFCAGTSEEGGTYRMEKRNGAEEVG